MAEDYTIQGLTSAWNGDGLSNAERQMVRALLEPGQPLWKIVREMVDYREDLKSSLMDADLTDPTTIRNSIKVQATAAAITEFVLKLETSLELQPEEELPNGD